MELYLKRIAKKGRYTIGHLYMDSRLNASIKERVGVQDKVNQQQGVDDENLKCNTRLVRNQVNFELQQVPIRNEEEETAEEGLTYICDTLEPPVLATKTTQDMNTILRLPRKADKLKPFAIPPGRYAVVISYSPKFNRWLPILLGVKGFKGIRIHAGNSVEDTQGCILVGDNLKVGKVLHSVYRLKIIKQLIVNTKAKDEAVWLTVLE